MNRFVIVDGLPYLFANGKTYAVRWDEAGFTVGAEVELASVPGRTYSELSVKAKCANNLDSIGAIHEDHEDQEDQNDQKDQHDQDDQDGNDQEDQNDQENTENQEGTAFDEMKLEELKDYAKEHGISLNGARTKAAIIEAIKAGQVVNPDADDR